MLVPPAKPCGPQGTGMSLYIAVGSLARLGRACRIEIHVIGHEQIKKTVAVIIQKTAACTPAVFRSSNASLFGHVGESAVAIVVVKNVAAKIADEQIVETVVVVVADATALSPARVGQARPSR